MQNLYEAALGDKNQSYYAAKFEQFDRQGATLKRDWNWSACLFGGIWALYRKMYGWFLVSLGIAFFCSLIDRSGSVWLAQLVYISYLIPFSIFANSLYYGNVKKKIASAQRTGQDDAGVIKIIQYGGGTHKWVVWLFGSVPVIGIILAIMIPMYAHQTGAQQRQWVDPWANKPHASKDTRLEHILMMAREFKKDADRESGQGSDIDMLKGGAEWRGYIAAIIDGHDELRECARNHSMNQIAYAAAETFLSLPSDARVAYEDSNKPVYFSISAACDWMK